LSGSVRVFEFFSVSFYFRARDPFAFPAFLTGNVFRGALGSFLQSANPSAYRILFGPAASDASVGTTPPRPFVLRCRTLEGRSYSPGETFPFQLNLFLPDLHLLEALSAALTAMGDAGFGPTRRRATLQLPPVHARHSLRLNGPFEPTREIRVHFQTPTEVKNDGEVSAPGSFPVLLGQVYGRLNRLSTLYGSGALGLDRSSLMKQAGSVLLSTANLNRVEVSRRGTRFGQTHPIGGFVGSVDYSGDLDRFLPLLEAAAFTGVGRHTVWGNGEISTERLG
jgi:hypothetical protein